jgi:hypothetical protein
VPQTISQAEFDFLVDLNAHVARGFSQGSYAAKIGVADGTITYRLRPFRLRSERGVGLVDIESGETFEAQVTRGDYAMRITCLETPEEVAA